MAHFHKIPSGEKISNQTIKAPGLSCTVGLWGYLGYSDKELYVDYYPQIGIDLERGGIVGNSRLYTVRGGPGKKARVEAFADAAVWDWFEIEFGAATTDCSSLKTALSSGRLILNNPTDAITFPAICAGRQIDAQTGLPVHYAPELIRLLDSLLAGGQLRVMSLYRPSYMKDGKLMTQGPHGEVQGTSMVVRAVDVAGYGGRSVTLTPRADAISVVANLIRNFGPGNYDLGFPRPVGGPTGFDPSQDIFFAVPDLLTASLCFQGRISRTLGQMLEPAQTEVRAAMGSSSGKFPIMYPDGLNHLHVKAY
jgi:hypothetical protein